MKTPNRRINNEIYNSRRAYQSRKPDPLFGLDPNGEAKTIEKQGGGIEMRADRNDESGE